MIEEEYIFHLENDKMNIAGIDVGLDPVASQLIDDYFDDYYDMQKVKKYYIPYVVGNTELYDVESMKLLADFSYEVGGEYIKHEIIEYKYYYDKLDWTDTTYFLALVSAEMEFEKENFMLYAEISKEENDIKFNYVEYYPLDAYNVLEEYYSNVSKKDTNKIMEMYVDRFFESSEVTGEEWKASILNALTNDYGAFIDYTIYSWDYETVSFNNQEVEVYSFLIASQYEDITFEEHLMIIKDKTSQAIVGHQIY